eukprot:TRINITY_DN36892_c0_g1_i1.p1 TRINITY_DN36892_c0_g1~~TRINITY_DN36892_c0_g1_i1.p1  ORF type:complete len:657 (+),score=101.07 TRINITY_DN36892_c0_g1_i1:152-1972(+)
MQIGAEEDHVGVLELLDEDQDCTVGNAEEIGKSILRPRTAPAPALSFFPQQLHNAGISIVDQMNESTEAEEEEGADTAWAKAAVAARTETMPSSIPSSAAFNSNMFRDMGGPVVACPANSNGNVIPQNHLPQAHVAPSLLFAQQKQQQQPQTQPQQLQQQQPVFPQQPPPQQLFNSNVVIQPSQPHGSGFVKQQPFPGTAPQHVNKQNNINIISPANGVGIHKPNTNTAMKETQAGKGSKKGMAPPASQLMEEFRRKSRLWELPDFAGHVLEFSRDQDGSRLIQKKLEQSCQLGDVGRMQLDAIFVELLPEALHLMTDVFGNYVIQKLLEFGQDTHRAQLVGVMKNCVVDLTKQTYGCRVVQKALDLVPHELQQVVLSELQGHVPECVVDQNGNHVIQKCVECLPGQSAFIIQSFLTRVDTLATHPYGCRVLQKILEYGKQNPQSQLAQSTANVLHEIIRNVQMLVMNQNGNYVVQHVMTNTPPHYAQAIVNSLTPMFVKLSCHKFASNVAEKVYHHATPEQRVRIVQTICQPTTPGAEPSLFKMVGDQFGNYVIQKALNNSDQAAHMLVQHLRPNFDILHRVVYGKHIIAKIEKLDGRQMGANRS